MKKFTRIRLFPFVFCLLSAVYCLAQQKPVVQTKKAIAADCDKAILIDLGKVSSYGPTVAPDSCGKKQEIKHIRKNIFETEHNTAWYLLNVVKDGEFIFEIIPDDTLNDYDFILYSYTDSTFCPAFEQGSVTPLRNNLSNVKRSVKGVTGLATNAAALSIGKGIGNPYSKPLQVKKGERYMLILDNVHPGGKGHTLLFNYMKDVTIKGKVLNSDSVPVISEITLSDNKGRTILETKSDKNGDYNIKTSLVENQNYSFSIISENTFVDIKTINTKTHKDANDIRVMLPLLKKGEKYKLGNINFFGDLATLLPYSYPSVEALYKLMRKNKNMVIEIEGHTNGDDWSRPANQQSSREKGLSEDRANVIYKYLIAKGIQKERMSKVGYGSTKVLFKSPKSELESSANRRVEIKVISIE